MKNILIYRTVLPFEEALVELRHYSDKGGYRHVLVFDERFNLAAVLSMRDLIQGDRARVFQNEGGMSQKYEGYCLPEDRFTGYYVAGCLFLKDCKKRCRSLISEILPSNRITTADADDPVAKARILMLKEDVNALAVVDKDKV